MQQRATFILESERDRGFALSAVMKAPLGRQVRISKPTRTNEQNSRLHALLTDLSEQLIWPPPPANTGELHDLEYWKRACTLTWLHETNAHPEIITTLDGQHIGLFVPRTSELDVTEAASLNVWIEAFGSLNGVVWTEPKSKNGPEPPPHEDYR